MTTVAEALRPVRAELIRRAEADAAATLAEADRAAETTLAEAQGRAEAIMAEARARGAAEGRAVRAAGRARTRRAARESRLRGQRKIYDELLRRVLAALPEVRATPGYPGLRAELAAQARATLGPQARLSEPPGGGIIAQLDGRRVDYSLETLARQAVDALAAELEELWTP
ncbi:MAG TPA: hypothetical protein VFV67_01605 [Actinophytocola sp.]|uniref:hypothetical protein n=1 Tax=Actinophytocola sp. TaxID=1872138 RepID=UPI002DBA2BE1|nr:hypothetical protein [Actinophytocola sp.]HEU5469320.1 hypothetical protein [Actinophytocola sp.]